MHSDFNNPDTEALWRGSGNVSARMRAEGGLPDAGAGNPSLGLGSGIWQGERASHSFRATKPGSLVSILAKAL
jgi:hypothetical protein